MAKTNSGLVAYSKKQVGLPYWYGTYGQTADESLYNSKKKQYPKQYTATDFASQYGKRVHDCVGLIKGYLWSDSATATPSYKAAQDKSASGMYAAADSGSKGKISTFPKTNGLLVFRGTSASAIHHVGVYADGYVYEAKGHSSGVVKTKYSADDWNFWAQCPYCTDDTTTASSTSTTSTTKTAATSTAEPKTIWNYLMGKIGNAFGVAGLRGNLYAESGLIPNNLQNSYQSKLGYTDASYTAAVDDGSYTKFSSDSAGYGLAQWTYSTRKKALKAYADSKNASIGNLTMQLEFLLKELTESYNSVLGTLCTATTVLEASNAVLINYEKPANTGSSVQKTRASYGQKYYDAYAGTSTSTSSKTTTASKPSYTVGKTYTLQTEVNVRKGAGTGYAKVGYNGLTADGKKHDKDKDGALDKGTVVTCKEVKTVGNDIWIRCPSGWLAAYYGGDVYIK